MLVENESRMIDYWYNKWLILDYYDVLLYIKEVNLEVSLK